MRDGRSGSRERPGVAAKIRKLRAAPEQFFADAKSPALRSLGLVFAPALSRSAVMGALLEDPVDALRQRQLPLVSRLLARRDQREAREREALLRHAKRPIVSVIMAARNAEDCVQRAVRSLLAQSYRELEIIVVDDASDDGTCDVVRALAASDPRVRLVRNERRRGAAMTRNAGLAHSTGAYLTFQDADDVSHPERIERQLAALLEAGATAAFCICNYVRETPDGERVVVNGHRFAKSVISMLFPRDPVLDRLGYMVALEVGEDSEYYQRMRAVFGRNSEVHLFQTLYRARFAAGSLLFSHGEVTDSADGVSYTQSAPARAAYDRAMERVEAVRRHEASPFVPLSE